MKDPKFIQIMLSCFVSLMGKQVGQSNKVEWIYHSLYIDGPAWFKISKA